MSQFNFKPTELNNESKLQRYTLTYGTFDLLHYGHIHLFSKAIALGLPLAVGISTAEFNNEKGKEAIQSFEERAYLVSRIKGVQVVFAEKSWDQKRSDCLKYNAEFLVMGSDWQGKFGELSDITNVIIFDRTPEISSSAIRSLSKSWE